MFVTINGGERPQAAAFDPRPFLEVESSNSRASAFGQFQVQRRSLFDSNFETKKKKTVALVSAGILKVKTCRTMHVKQGHLLTVKFVLQSSSCNNIVRVLQGGEIILV